jgi:hypothetical protein
MNIFSLYIINESINLSFNFNRIPIIINLKEKIQRFIQNIYNQYLIQI